MSLKTKIIREDWVKWAPPKRQLGKIARLVAMIEKRNARIAELEEALKKALLYLETSAK